MTTDSKLFLFSTNFICHFVCVDVPFDERRTFLTEFTHEENEEEQNPIELNSMEGVNAVNQLINMNHNNNETILQILEIKQISSKTSSDKQRQFDN